LASLETDNIEQGQICDELTDNRNEPTGHNHPVYPVYDSIPRQQHQLMGDIEQQVRTSVQATTARGGAAAAPAPWPETGESSTAGASQQKRSYKARPKPSAEDVWTLPEYSQSLFSCEAGSDAVRYEPIRVLRELAVLRMQQINYVAEEHDYLPRTQHLIYRTQGGMWQRLAQTYGEGVFALSTYSVAKLIGHIRCVKEHAGTLGWIGPAAAALTPLVQMWLGRKQMLSFEDMQAIWKLYGVVF
jgi:hypothetical protein